jgi:hypothetical protein
MEKDSLIYRISKEKELSSNYVVVIDEKHIGLVRNFKNIVHKFNSRILCEVIVVNLSTMDVIEHLMFDLRIENVKKKLHKEVDGNIIEIGETSNLELMLRDLKNNLSTMYDNKNIVPFNKYKSVTGETIKFSKSDQNKWSNKAIALSGISQERNDKS